MQREFKISYIHSNRFLGKLVFIRFYLENFRSIHYALLDCACREYLFILDFFLPSDQAKVTMFNIIFQNILSALISHLETYVADCWDAIALFLCIHIILRYQVIAHQVRFFLNFCVNFYFSAKFLFWTLFTRKFYRFYGHEWS